MQSLRKLDEKHSLNLQKRDEKHAVKSQKIISNKLSQPHLLLHNYLKKESFSEIKSEIKYSQSKSVVTDANLIRQATNDLIQLKKSNRIEKDKKLYTDIIDSLILSSQENIISLKQVIENYNFNLSFPRGKSLSLTNGSTKRVPHRIYAIYQLINNQNLTQNEKTRQIAILAAEALNQPSYFGQAAEAHYFYEKILECLIMTKKLSNITATVELKNIDDLIHFLKSWPEKYFKEFSIENVSLFDKVFEKTDIINIIQSIDSYEQIVELLEINPAFIYYILSNAKITPNDTFIYYILSNDELRIFDNNQLIHNLLKNRKNYNKDDAVTALLIEKSISLNVFSDSKKFIELAEINWEMANTLIQYKEIYDLVKNDLPFAYFSSINKEDGMDDKQILENKLQHSFFSSLDLSISPTRRKIKKLEELDLAFDEKKQKDFNREEMVSHFLSTSEFIFEMMYGESGYYSTGKIAFQSHNNTSGDFITTASNYRTRSVFSANMAYQLFNYRKTMIENGVIKSTDFFDVLECGAGEGHLCGAILDAIEAMSKKNSEWKEFHQQIRYTILEKSPALVERQKITNLRHGGKVKYINGDAMQMKNHLSANHYSAVISNELLDMFPPHRVMRTADGQLSTEIMVISINEKAYKEFFETKIINENKQDLTFDNLKQRSDQYKKRLNSFSQQIPAVNNKAMLILNKKDFLKLHTYYSSDPKFSPQKDVKDDISVFSFSNVYVDIIHFPDLQKYMENHPEISSKIKKNKPTLIVLGIDNFILGSEYALKNGGFILSVDYGGNSLEASHDIRTYYKGVSGGHFTRCPGFIDITIDVDFTILVESGKQYGIDLVWFMNQGHVSNDPVFIDLFVNNGILKKVDIDYYILTDGALKACLQSKTKLEELKQSNSIHNTFFLPQSIPVTYAQNFLKRKTDFTKGMDYEKTHNDDKRINSRTF